MAKKPLKLAGQAIDTANERLLSDAIRHAVYNERLKTYEANKIIQFLEQDVFKDLIDKLRIRISKITERGFDVGPATTRRIRTMLGDINDIIGSGVKEANSILVGDLKQIAIHESEWQVKTLTNATPDALKITYQIPTPTQLNTIITSDPMQGDILKKWGQRLSASSQEELRRAVQIGMVEGESIPKIINRVAGADSASVFNKIKRNVASYTRTAVSHVNNRAAETTWQENEDMIKGVVYVATLDSRTTLICMGLDGEVFKVGDGPRPPQHYNCRSTTAPVLKSWEELGIKANEIPAGTRVSMNGQVPKEMTYNDWLKKMDSNPKTQSIVDDALGRERAKLFREGVPVQKFTDSNNSPLTLAEIRVKEGMA